MRLFVPGLHATVVFCASAASRTGDTQQPWSRGNRKSCPAGAFLLASPLNARICASCRRYRPSLPSSRRKELRDPPFHEKASVAQTALPSASSTMEPTRAHTSAGGRTRANSRTIRDRGRARNTVGLTGQALAELAGMDASAEKLHEEGAGSSKTSRSHFDTNRFSDLLSKEEEVVLGRKVQEMLRWERVRSFLEMRLGREATLEEWANEVAAWDGAEGMARDLRDMKDARARMISSNLRLVLHMARKTYFAGGSGSLKTGLDDMIQDGVAGLVKAVERFDPEKGFRFSTYASWWVYQGIHGGLASGGRVIRLPMNIHSDVCRVVRMQTKLADLLKREPTAGEICIASGIPEKKVQHSLRANKVEPYSLDARAWTKSSDESNGAAWKVSDSLPTAQEQEPVAGADVSLLRSEVDAILEDLTEREAFVLRMRFGIGGRTPWTLETVGGHLRLTRERVRQIQCEALEKLRGAVPASETLDPDQWRRRVTPWEQYNLPPSLLLQLVEHGYEPGHGPAGSRQVRKLSNSTGAETGSVKRSMLDRECAPNGGTLSIDGSPSPHRRHRLLQAA